MSYTSYVDHGDDLRILGVGPYTARLTRFVSAFSGLEGDAGLVQEEELSKELGEELDQ